MASTATSKKYEPGTQFGDCMFGRHSSCKKVLESGKVCACECENHGVDYKPLDLNTPVHVLFRKVADAYKRGEVFSETEEAKVGTDALELKYQQVEPLPQTEEQENAVEDTLEQLEQKRNEHS